GRRPEGSSSKLSTFRDGARILWMFAMLVKETQPQRFFGTFALFFLAASIGLMIPLLVEFAETGLVPRMPTWVLSVGLLLSSMLAMVTGLILDSVSRGRAEQKRIFYLS
ncbi:glycosyl transferase, partial [Mesorhizobium sp. M8A.F.Ca.ET.202.01.1.1]